MLVFFPWTFWILFLSKLGPCLLILGVGCRFCRGCIMTMKNVKRNCFQNSFSSPKRLNFFPFSVFLEWYGKKYILLYVFPNIQMTRFSELCQDMQLYPQSFLFCHNSLTTVQEGTVFYIVTSAICYYEIHSEDKHSIITNRYTSGYTNALEPCKLPGATRIT